MISSINHDEVHFCAVSSGVNTSPLKNTREVIERKDGGTNHLDAPPGERGAQAVRTGQRFEGTSQCPPIHVAPQKGLQQAAGYILSSIQKERDSCCCISGIYRKTVFILQGGFIAFLLTVCSFPYASGNRLCKPEVSNTNIQIWKIGKNKRKMLIVLWQLSSNSLQENSGALYIISWPIIQELILGQVLTFLPTFHVLVSLHSSIYWKGTFA